eukprot:361095-Chlamydomonas_euryale.AAC.12
MCAHRERVGFPAPYVTGIICRHVFLYMLPGVVACCSFDRLPHTHILFCSPPLQVWAAAAEPWPQEVCAGV